MPEPLPVPGATPVVPDLDVVVHPLVLLSAVDHYNRVCKDTKKRAVGVLLGSKFKKTVDITNSFAVPFEEDLRNPDIWYLDHNFLESMEGMFRKVNAKEKVVGFYTTGPKIRHNDLAIADLFRRYCSDPIYVMVDVRPGVEGIPTTAYRTVDEVEQDGKEVGVEHLLRDINDPSVSTLACQIKHTMTTLSGLQDRLEDMKVYLEQVLAGKLTVNNQIIYNMQNIFNLLPNLNVDELVRSMLVKSNDMHMVIYISSLIRCIIALHELVNNKITFRDNDIDPEEAKKAKEKEAEEAEEKEKAAAEKQEKGGDAMETDDKPKKGSE